MRTLRRTIPNPQKRGGVKRAIAIWAAVAGLGIFAGNKLLNHSRNQTENQQRIERRIENTPRRMESNPPIYQIPKEPLHFESIPKGNYCTMYARLAAEKLFEMNYKRGDAWDFAQNNRSIWKGSTTEIEQLSSIIRPGHVFGLYNPKSNYNSSHREYTHTALYVGFSNGQHWVMQRIGTSDRLESLEKYLKEHPGWKIKEVIEPAKN